MQKSNPELVNKLTALVEQGLNPEEIVKSLQEEVKLKALEEAEGPADEERFPEEILIISQALAYRDAIESDLIEIARLLNAAYEPETRGEEAFRRGDGITADSVGELFQDKSYLWQIVEAPNGRGIEVDGVMLGVCCFSIDGISRRNGEVEGNLGAIRLFGILPRFRGVCIGLRLLRRVEAFMMQSGCCRVMACIPSPRKSMAEWLERKKYLLAGTSPYPARAVGHEVLEEKHNGEELKLLMYIKALEALTLAAEGKDKKQKSSIALNSQHAPAPPTVTGKMHLPPHWRYPNLPTENVSEPKSPPQILSIATGLAEAETAAADGKREEGREARSDEYEEFEDVEDTRRGVEDVPDVD